MLSKILTGQVKLEDVLPNNSLFRWEQQQGERSINRQLSARGMYGSGAGLETLARFNNELMGNFGNSFMSNLFNLTTLGSNAATQQASMTNQTGQGILNLTEKTAPALGAAAGNQYRSIGEIGTNLGNLV